MKRMTEVCAFLLRLPFLTVGQQFALLTNKKKKMRKEKKFYVQPTISVVPLQVTNHLLAGSVETRNYTWHDEDEE